MLWILNIKGKSINNLSASSGKIALTSVKFNTNNINGKFWEIVLLNEFLNLFP